MNIFHGSWYRGQQTKLIPNKKQLEEQNAIKKYFVDGWASPGLVKKRSPVLSFGSCFARHVTEILATKA